MTVYYVDGAVGNDANAGTSEGAGNAWATIDKAMNTVVAGDHVYVKASATYSESPSIDTAGAITNPIVFEGYSSTPGDNGKVTISDATTCLTTSFGGFTSAYYWFRNFKFNGSQNGVNAFNARYLTFFNCEMSNNSAKGVIPNQYRFVNCEVLNNGNDGLGDLAVALIGCIVANSSQAGVDGPISFAYRNLFYGNVRSAIAETITYGAGNTFVGSDMAFATDGLAGSGNIGQGYYIDSIIYDSFGFGIDISPTFQSALWVHEYNLLNSNAQGDYSETVDTRIFNTQSVTGAPAFTSEAGDDYTLDAASPAIDAGVTPGGIT